jgi:hypothetical protein
MTRALYDNTGAPVTVRLSDSRPIGTYTANLAEAASAAIGQAATFYARSAALTRVSYIDTLVYRNAIQTV